MTTSKKKMILKITEIFDTYTVMSLGNLDVGQLQFTFLLSLWKILNLYNRIGPWQVGLGLSSLWWWNADFFTSRCRLFYPHCNSNYNVFSQTRSKLWRGKNNSVSFFESHQGRSQTGWCGQGRWGTTLLNGLNPRYNKKMAII